MLILQDLLSTQRSLQKKISPLFHLQLPSITTVITLSGNYDSNLIGTLLVMLAFTLIMLLTFLLFYHAPWLQEHLPQTTINLITRMMGLLLTVIAVQMVSTGMLELFPGLR